VAEPGRDRARASVYEVDVDAVTSDDVIAGYGPLTAVCVIPKRRAAVPSRRPVGETLAALKCAVDAALSCCIWGLSSVSFSFGTPDPSILAVIVVEDDGHRQQLSQQRFDGRLVESGAEVRRG